MEARQNRKPSRAGVTKSVVLDPALVQAVAKEAEREGHNNFSMVVAKALREFFARISGDKEAA